MLHSTHSVKRFVYPLGQEAQVLLAEHIRQLDIEHTTQEFANSFGTKLTSEVLEHSAQTFATEHLVQFVISHMMHVYNSVL